MHIQCQVVASALGEIAGSPMGTEDGGQKMVGHHILMGENMHCVVLGKTEKFGWCYEGNFSFDSLYLNCYLNFYDMCISFVINK
jgi:hypothetical protein